MCVARVSRMQDLDKRLSLSLELYASRLVNTADYRFSLDFVWKIWVAVQCETDARRTF